MKKLMVGVAAIAAIVGLTGCKGVPTVEEMSATSYSIGVATGMVTNNTKIDDESRNAVVDIVNKVEACVPETTQTFTEAWTPIADAHIKQLLEEKKIDEGKAFIIKSAFTTVVAGIDYIFEVKYPAAKEKKELVEAAVHGFCKGFLTVFKPVNGKTDTNGYDKETYEYLQKKETK